MVEDLCRARSLGRRRNRGREPMTATAQRLEDVVAGSGPIQSVILSGAGTSRSEVPAESKDPYRTDRSQRRVVEFSPSIVLGIGECADGRLPRRRHATSPENFELGKTGSATLYSSFVLDR